jgi:hypothetical protein
MPAMFVSFDDESSDEVAQRTEADIHQAELVGLLVNELSMIATEIEDLPLGSPQLSGEQIMAIQKIDFCRQRLMEVTKIMRNAFGQPTAATLHDLEEILMDVGLEHTLDKFRKAS